MENTIARGFSAKGTVKELSEMLIPQLTMGCPACSFANPKLLGKSCACPDGPGWAPSIGGLSCRNRRA